MKGGFVSVRWITQTASSKLWWVVRALTEKYNNVRTLVCWASKITIIVKKQDF